MCKLGRTDGVGHITMSNEQFKEAKQRIQDCSACIQGKMDRPRFGHRGLDKGTTPGEVLHMDTAFVTLMDEKTGRKRIQYWLVLVDAYSESRWSSVTDTKSELAAEVEGIIRQCQSMTGRKVRALYTDGGGEFIKEELKRFCRKNGTVLEPSPARTPELNGIAERNVASYKNAVRTMMKHSQAEATLWRYAAAYQAYIWNRTRIIRATGKTPIEEMTGRTASVLHIGVFGCDAWVHQDRSQRETTFSAKAEPGIYLGHSPVQRCAIVKMLSSGKIIHTRDVEFREGSFTHMRALTHGRVERVLEQQYQPLSGDEDVIGSGSRSPLRTPEYEDEADTPEESKSETEAKEESDSDDSTEGEYTVESITGHKGKGRKLQYRVQWKGYSEPTWEPAANLKRASETVRKYRERNAASNPAPPKQVAFDKTESLSVAAQSAAVSSDDDDAAFTPAVRMAMSAIGCSRL
jgi:hypothetical protein